MISVNALSKSFGDRTLLSEVTFNVNPGEKIGLVGRNGTGKSTLIKMILGKETPDSGSITIPKGYRIGALDQHISFNHSSIIEECAASLPVEEKYDHYKAEAILFGLGFSKEDMDRSPEEFSGGFQIRIMLCKLLLQSPDMLLLDEPTNYLDIPSLIWLQSFLKGFPKEVILITHDASFMDKVVTDVMGISRKSVRKISGQTSNYYQQLKLEDEEYERTRLNQEKKVAELQEFADKYRAKARKASQAQSKLKQIERMDVFEKLQDDAELAFKFHYLDYGSKNALEVDNLRFGYDDTDLIEDLAFSIKKGEKVGIIGKNGKGKSTLLNLIGGALTPKEGEISFHGKVKIGHFGQTNIERLHPEHSVVQEIKEANDNLSETAARSIAGAMMFSGDNGDKKIKVLSGGEKSRVMLGKVLASPVNFLLLDEPTNHLDLESVDSLTREIKQFPGAVLLVTHNERMLQRVCDNLIVFTGENAIFFRGGYKDFEKKIGWEESSQNGGLKKNTKRKKISSRDHKLKIAKITEERTKKIAPLEKKITECELKIEIIEKTLARKGEELRAASESFQQDEIGKLSREIGILNSEIEKTFQLMEENFEKCSELKDRFEKELKDLT